MTLAQLLVVQEHDSTIDRLAHSRKTLPEFAVLATLADEQNHLESQRLAVAEQRAVFSREQKRLEDEASIVTERIDRENLRLYDGSVTAHKDLQAIQDELKVLGRRRSDFEDGVLEAMEAGEPLDEQLGVLDGQLANVEERHEQATESLAHSQADIDAQVDSVTAQRAEAVADVDATLVELYETSRADCSGVGICRLIDKTCQGCHLTLPAVQYDRIRKEPDDAIVRCVECTRILVR